MADDLTLRAAGGVGALHRTDHVARRSGLRPLVRDTAGSPSLALGLLYGSPILARSSATPLATAPDRYSPSDAGLVIQSTRDLADEPIGPWAGLGVLSLYVATAVIAGLVVFQFRDAR